MVSTMYVLLCTCIYIYRRRGTFVECRGEGATSRDPLSTADVRYVLCVYTFTCVEAAIHFNS